MVSFAELGRRERLVLKMLRTQGPLTDGQLAWYARHLNMTAGSATSARRRLTVKGLVRFAHKCRLVGNGPFAQVWEALR